MNVSVIGHITVLLQGLGAVNLAKLSENWQIPKQRQHPDLPHAPIGVIEHRALHSRVDEAVITHRKDAFSAQVVLGVVVCKGQSIIHEQLYVKLFGQAAFLKLHDSLFDPVGTIFPESFVRNLNRWRTEIFHKVVTGDLRWNLANHDHSNEERTGVWIDLLLSESPASSTFSVDDVHFTLSEGTVCHAINIAVASRVIFGSNDYLPVVGVVAQAASTFSNRELLPLVKCDEDTALVELTRLKMVDGMRAGGQAPDGSHGCELANVRYAEGGAAEGAEEDNG